MTEPIGTPGGTPERPALFFSGPEEFRAWLEANHETATELWMGLNKKHVADRGLTWEEAVPEALCFGWIDSVAQRIDEDTRRQRWTPRKAASTWSAVNIALVERLTAEGRMHPAGTAAFERRREDRSAIYSHENPELALPPEFAARLAADAAASAFWEAATAGYRRQVVHWVLTAKQEATRERRLAQLIEESAAGRLVPFQRYGEEPKWVARAAGAARAATAPE
ncbi:YdeI/OmpD-associated family protein [Agromyces tropicus]|uniref:YdeI/OmpD-associated family protein n=1 Tax=Agromyces tropicus TaxID=555371 RepID=A0ABN2USC9_9MICO